MHKITIIGGSGFVGTRLIQAYGNQTEYEIQNIDKKTSYFYNNKTKIADIRNKNDLDVLLKDTDVVVLLAAEHKDNVTPTSLYYDVNVEGMHNVLWAMEQNNIKHIVFTSSVAVYGLNKINPNEEHHTDPFNHYGKSKWQAELLLQDWYKKHPDWNINIIRPTVIFGERNRGNVYNLLKQIASGRFLMVGNGKNKKSMAYVGNVVSFIQFIINKQNSGYNVYNYIDKPDMTINELVNVVGITLNKKIPSVHLPYFMGMLGGYCLDTLSFITKKEFPISSIRIKKFCATTQYDSTKVKNTGFIPPFSLEEGLQNTLISEFVNNSTDHIFESE